MPTQEQARCPHCGHNEFKAEYAYVRERAYLVYCVSCSKVVGVVPDYDTIAAEVPKRLGK